MKPFFPAYLNLSPAELESRIRSAAAMLAECRMCARDCRVDRLAFAAGAAPPGLCETGTRARVVSYSPNFSEEAPLVGEHGSGTIFFGGLSLKFQFSQHYEIHRDEVGLEMEPEQLAAIMLELQDQGCHNINLVSPSHVVPQFLEALRIALKAGLYLPLVYNSDGYEALPTLRLLGGIVDIYVVDMRYADPAVADRYSRVMDYVRVNREATREMHHQVGDLTLDEEGVAKHGLIIRHMVLPSNLGGTEEVARYLVDEISATSYVNVMRQFRPSGGKTLPELNRPITDQEYAAALHWVKHAGLHRVNPEPGARTG
jgi:putative pyruvate formate lyase activating enzyme